MSRVGLISEQLLRDLLTEAEELAEKFADDRAQYREWGSDKEELRALKYERHTRSVIRRARKVLAELLGRCARHRDDWEPAECGDCRHALEVQS